MNLRRRKIILKWFAGLTVLTIVGISVFYFYFIYINTPDKPALSGEFKQDVLEMEDESRTFDYYLPRKLEPRPALVFVLHGSRSDGRDIRKQTGYEFDRIADTDGFIVVYPNGYEKHWNDCRASAQYSANIKNIDDNAFFKEMFSYFIKKYSIDSSRIFVTGFSNGGHMAYRLAYEMPSQIAAIAVIAANLPVDNNLDCEKREEPISVAIFNGTEDSINPYNGGLVKLLGDTSRGTVLSTKESANYWVGLALIERKSDTIRYNEIDGDPSTSVSLVRWVGSQGIQICLYTLQGSGHVIPSTKVRFGRANAGDIEAAVEIWRFFSEVGKLEP